jgi:hypothetical protein
LTLRQQHSYLVVCLNQGKFVAVALYRNKIGPYRITQRGKYEVSDIIALRPKPATGCLVLRGGERTPLPSP